MIKNRGAALGYRVFMLGVCLYCGFQLLITQQDGANMLWKFPYYFWILTILALLYLIIKGLGQIRKNGLDGLTTWTKRVRGGFVVSSIILLFFYIVLLRPSMVIVDNSIIDWILFTVLPIFWMLDWILFDERNQTQWFDPIVWTIAQVVGYVGVILIRANITKQDNPYVYDVLNVGKYGMAAVAKNVVVMCLLFLVVSTIVYSVDSIGKKQEQK